MHFVQMDLGDHGVQAEVRRAAGGLGEKEP